MKKTSLILSVLLVVLLGLAQNPISVAAATPVGQTYVVDVISHFGATNTVTTSTGALNYGTKVGIDPTSGSYPDYAFAFWIVNGVVRKDLAVNYQFTVTEDLNLEAIFKPTGFFAVVFMDSNGKSLEVEYVSSGGSATPPESLPTKIGYTYADPQWLGSYTNVTEDTAIILQYVLSNASTYTVTITNVANVTADKVTYAYNEVATLTADATDGVNPFSHWAIGTHIVSYDRIYKTTMIDNIYMKAIYLATPLTASAVIMISDALALRDTYVTYKGQFDLPSGYELIEYGILASTNYLYTIDIDTVDMTKYKSEKYNGSTGEFVMSIPSVNVKTARGYLIYNDGDSIEIAYSDMSLANGETVIIYEVYGGGGNTGAPYSRDFVTLYNSTSKPIVLTGWSLQYTSATGTSWGSNKTNLVGTIQPYSFFLFGGSSGAVGAALPTVDHSGTTNMSGTAGKIALVNSTTALPAVINPVTDVTCIDLVGYGTTANGYEGTGPAPATSNTTSDARKAYVFDTDQNSSDFIAGAPNPKNSASVPW